MNRESEAFAHSSATGEALEDTNRAGHIETRGLDYIPGPERHGRPFELFWVWMSGNVNYLSFVFGGLLILIGLSVWEAIIVTIIGNLWWIAVGWLSVSGPASGTPSVTVMRAMFGDPRQSGVRRRPGLRHRLVLRDPQHRLRHLRIAGAARRARRARARRAPSGSCSSGGRAPELRVERLRPRHDREGLAVLLGRVRRRLRGSRRVRACRPPTSRYVPDRAGGRRALADAPARPTPSSHPARSPGAPAPTTRVTSPQNASKDGVRLVDRARRLHPVRAHQPARNLRRHPSST